MSDEDPDDPPVHIDPHEHESEDPEDGEVEGDDYGVDDPS